MSISKDLRNILEDELVKAAESGRKEDVRYLLDAGVDVNIRNSRALHVASANGHVDVIPVLLDRGANVDEEDEKGNTALHDASSGDVSGRCVKLLVEAGASVNSKGSAGTRPLQLAAHSGHADVISLLLRMGANINAKDDHGNTALHAAALGDVSGRCAKLLIEAGAEVNASSLNNHTPLHNAARHCFLDVLSLLLENGAELNARNRDGNVALHEAALGDATGQCLIFLIEAGAEVNIVNDCGDTPLHLSTRRGHPDAVSLLLEKGAFVNAINGKLKTVLHESAQWDPSQRCMPLLINAGADVNVVSDCGLTPLHLAAFQGYKYKVSLLLEKGAQIESRDASGNTPLHSAAYGDSSGHCAKLLIEAGAVVNISNDCGSTPLQMAVRHSHEDVISVLLENGADVTVRNERGNTVLHEATFSDKSGRCTKLLIDAGSKVNVSTFYCDTPLHSACSHGNESVVSVLLENGADINARNETGNSALHEATLGDTSGQCTKLLIGAGVNVNVSNLCGDTPLQLACRHSNRNVVSLLLENGADIDATGLLGHTALHVTARHGHADIMSLLLEMGANVNAKDWKRNTALHTAALEDPSGECVKLLIEAGSDINVLNGCGDTPLYLAVRRNHEHIVEMLLENGPNLDISDESGNTVLHEAAFCDTPGRCTKLLIDAGVKVNTFNTCGDTALHWACHRGNENVVSVLLDNGANTDARNELGQTALHLDLQMASRSGGQCAKLLIKAGADVNLLDDNVPALRNSGGSDIQVVTGCGNTALQLAIREGCEDLVSLLLERGADLYPKDDSGNSMLHKTTIWDSSGRCAKLLIDAGARVNEKGSFGETPLHWAAVKGHADVVAILLKNGADKQALDYVKSTALHLAVSSTSIQCVSALVKAHADVNSKDIFGKTPLHVIADGGQSTTANYLPLLDYNYYPRGVITKKSERRKPDQKIIANIVGLLVAAGADVNCVDHVEGMTPLHIAALKNNETAARALLAAGAKKDIKSKSLFFQATPFECAWNRKLREMLRL